MASILQRRKASVEFRGRQRTANILLYSGACFRDAVKKKKSHASPNPVSSRITVKCFSGAFRHDSKDGRKL